MKVKVFVLFALSLCMSFAHAKWASDPRFSTAPVATEVEVATMHPLEQMQSLLREARYEMLNQIDRLTEGCPNFKGSPIVTLLLKEASQVGVRNFDSKVPDELFRRIGSVGVMCRLDKMF